MNICRRMHTHDPPPFQTIKFIKQRNHRHPPAYAYLHALKSFFFFNFSFFIGTLGAVYSSSDELHAVTVDIVFSTYMNRLGSVSMLPPHVLQSRKQTAERRDPCWICQGKPSLLRKKNAFLWLSRGAGKIPWRWWSCRRAWCDWAWQGCQICGRRRRPFRQLRPRRICEEMRITSQRFGLVTGVTDTAMRVCCRAFVRQWY